MKPQCPNCSSTDPNSGHVVVHGRFFRKSSNQHLTRYKCKICNRTFSQATLDPCFGQKKRHLNVPILKLYCSGASQRRLTRLLNCTEKTVVRKISFLARILATHLEEDIKNSPEIKHVQFDDLETSEHTKCKPLSITLLVQVPSRKILGSGVSPIAAKGKLAAISVKKYGKRKSFRKDVRETLLKNLKPWLAEDVVVETDEDPHYKSSTGKILPNCQHKTYKGRRGCVVGQGELKRGGFDPLFCLNHTAAMLRANINRLFRRTWNTTKKPERLMEHLILYTYYHNEVLLKQKNNIPVKIWLPQAV